MYVGKVFKEGTRPSGGEDKQTCTPGYLVFTLAHKYRWCDFPVNSAFLGKWFHSKKRFRNGDTPEHKQKNKKNIEASSISRNAISCGLMPDASSCCNLLYIFSPSTQDISVFQEGFEASDAVKSMAETGSPAALVVSLFLGDLASSTSLLPCV